MQEISIDCPRVAVRPNSLILRPIDSFERPHTIAVHGLWSKDDPYFGSIAMNSPKLSRSPQGSNERSQWIAVTSQR